MTTTLVNISEGVGATGSAVIFFSLAGVAALSTVRSLYKTVAERVQTNGCLHAAGWRRVPITVGPGATLSNSFMFGLFMALVTLPGPLIMLYMFMRRRNEWYDKGVKLVDLGPGRLNENQ